MRKLLHRMVQVCMKLSVTNRRSRNIRITRRYPKSPELLSSIALCAFCLFRPSNAIAARVLLFLSAFSVTSRILHDQYAFLLTKPKRLRATNISSCQGNMLKRILSFYGTFYLSHLISSMHLFYLFCAILSNKLLHKYSVYILCYSVLSFLPVW